MMNRLIFLLISLVISVTVFSQAPVINRTTGTNTVNDPRFMATKNLIAPRYTDTTAANLDLGADSCGALIFTYNTNNYWLRVCNPKRWTQVGEVATSNNGITKIGTNFEWGGTLIKPTLINASGANVVKITGSVPIAFPLDTFTVVYVENTATNGYTFRGRNKGFSPSVQGINEGSGYGLSGISKSGVGIYAVSSTPKFGQGFHFVKVMSDLPIIDTANVGSFSAYIEGSGNGAYNSGGALNFNLNGPSGQYRANRMLWFNDNSAPRSSRFEIWGSNNNVEARKFSIAPNGMLTFDAYAGSGLETVDTVANKPAAIDANGSLVKMQNWGGIGSNFFNSNLTANANRSHSMNNFDLTIDNIKVHNIISRGIDPGSTRNIRAARYTLAATSGGKIVDAVWVRNADNTTDSALNMVAVYSDSVSIESHDNGATGGSAVIVQPGIININGRDSLLVKGLVKVSSFDSIMVAVQSGPGRYKWGLGPVSALAATVNLSSIPSPTNYVIANTAGTGVTIPPVNATNSGVMLPGHLDILSKSYYIINALSNTAPDSVLMHPDDSTTVARQVNLINGTGINIVRSHNSSALNYTINSTTAGTLTSYTFNDGNGFDGTVSNSTTTPALSLTTTLTANSIPFITSGGAITQDNTNFNFNDASNTLTVPNITSPAGMALGTTGANALTLSTNGTTRISIAGTGAVGINTSTNSFNLPTGRGSSGQSLVTDGAGGTSWSTVSGGSMAIGGAVTSGTSQSVLFVDGSGNLAQDNATFNFNSSTDELFVPTVRAPAATDLTLRSPSGQKIDFITNSISRMSINNGGAIVFGSSGTDYSFPATRGIGRLTDAVGNGSLSWLKLVTNTTASGSTITPLADGDAYMVTALAANATIAAPTTAGTLTDGQFLVIRIKDNGTARTLSWNSVYSATEIALPTTTVINQFLYCYFMYNATDSEWDLVGLTRKNP